MIEINAVTRTYGRNVAVDDLTLAVQPGELFALLGPNGAGKTTTIKMLVGLLRASAGTIRVCGLDVALHTRQAVHLVGYVPDEAFLYEKLSGREFLEFTAAMRGLDRQGVSAAIDRQTEIFDLGNFLDRLVETYSHGMRQRLVFASAVLHDPTVLVIDEPMVGLDPRSVRLVKDLLRERAAAGRTVFMSTHTLTVAEEIADRIGIVSEGQLRFLGTVPELRQKLSSEQASLESLFLELTGDENGHGAASSETQSQQ